jgi:hypothetical protein
MIPTSSLPKSFSSRSSWTLLAFLTAATCFLGGCSTAPQQYHSVAYQPASMSDVKVKVSLKEQVVYVLEGNNLLMATPTCVGKPGYPTPTGKFKVEAKIQDKRSATYGYWVRGSEAQPGASATPPAGGGWSYVGYPMAFWVEFAPGFGFHEGPIWPYPRSHGCLHLHETASAKFFQLVEIGTPVEIAQSLPEDALYAKSVKRPTDYADPDPAPALMITPDFFKNPRENQLLPSPATAAPVAPTATAVPAGSNPPQT